MEKAAVAEWRKRKLVLVMTSIAMALLLWFTALPVYAAGGLELVTDYPGMAVKPGDSLNIPISLNNTSGSGMDADVAIASLPEGWEGYLQGGSYQVNRVHVGSRGRRGGDHASSDRAEGSDRGNLYGVGAGVFGKRRVGQLRAEFPDK